MKVFTVRTILSQIFSALSIITIFGLSLSVSTSVHAQDPNRPFLRITDINTENFPEVEVFIYGENLNGNLASLPLTLEQDNADQTLTSSNLIDVGVQTAIVVDASSNVLSPGNSGQTKLAEATGALNDFLSLGTLSAQTDWLALHATADSQDSFQVLADWQQDHQAVANALIQFQPSNPPSFTSLFGLIKFSFDQFQNAGVPNSVRRSIVVFSDGTDIVSNVEVDDVVRRAESLDVRIHTVMVGPAGDQDANRNMARLAEVTGGLYVQLNTVADVGSIWSRIAAERSQRLVTYRLDKAQPDSLEATMTTPDGIQVSHSKEYPTVGAQPVEISFVLPSAELPVVREADAPDTPINEMLPNALNVQVAFTWPDGNPRTFQRVEYSLNNNTRIVEEPPFDQFTFPIDALGEGDYTIRVNAIDELGIANSPPPRTVNIELRIPEAEPTLRPEPEALDAGVDAESGTESANEDAPQTEAGTEAGTATEANLESAASPIADDANSSGTVETVGNDAENGAAAQDGGIDLFGFMLPENINIGGYTIPINQNTLLVAALPLLFLLLLIIYFARRRPVEDPYDLSSSSDDHGAAAFYHEQSSVTVPAVSAFDVDDDSTEPVRLLKFAATAYLVYEEGGPHLPDKFPLEEGRELRIGRRSNLCDIVIDDKRVSRQHSTIEGKEDGFYLRDDGSAGGTYHNEKRLGVQDNRRLRHDDIINFNEIAYRFKVAANDDDDDDDVTIVDASNASLERQPQGPTPFSSSGVDTISDDVTVPLEYPPEEKDGPYFV